MKWSALAASLLLHCLLVGAFVAVRRPGRPPEPAQAIFFEIVEAAELQQTELAAVPPPADPVQSSPAAEPPVEPAVPAPIVATQSEPQPSAVEQQPAYEPDPPPPDPPPPDPPLPDPSPPSTAEKHSRPAVVLPAAEQVQAEERARVVSEPTALGRIVPVYPQTARRRGREGAVTVEAGVSAEGRVEQVVVVSSSGHADLDAAACRALGSANFAPATEDGRNVRGKVRLTFQFRLK